MEAMLAAVRAADQATLYSLYFPEHGHVKAAAVAGCVCPCLDDHTCTECERILGVSFRAIEHAARKKQRTGPHVPVARVDAGPGQGSHGAEASVAAISGMADRLERASRPPSDGVEGSYTADRLVVGSHPPSDGIEASDAANSSMEDPLCSGSNARVEGFEVAISGVAALPVPGSHPPSDMVEGSDAALSDTSDRLCSGSNGRVEGFEMAISSMAAPPVPCSHQPPDGVEGSDAAASGTVDRLVPGSHQPSDGIEGSEAAICSMADRLVPGSNDVVAEGFEAGISYMAARFGLPVAVGERAKEVFKKMEETKAWPHGPGWNKFRSECPLAYAACLSVACRNEGSALSLRELSLATAATRKEVARLIAHLRTRLGLEEAGQATVVGLVSVSRYVRRFGALVGLTEAESTAALEAARRLEAGVVDVRHNADSLAAGVVCRVLERAGGRRPGVKDVAAASGVHNHTIYAVCRKLRAHDGLLFA